MQSISYFKFQIIKNLVSTSPHIKLQLVLDYIQ